MTEQERLDLYTSIVPNRRQLLIQEMKYYAFVHYTVNTFTNKEWGNGKESEQVFNPTDQKHGPVVRRHPRRRHERRYFDL